MTPNHSDAIREIASNGITVGDLAGLTGLSATEIETALVGVPPMRGQQTRARVYDLYAAMSALVVAGEGANSAMIEEAIKRMKPNTLPPALSKEFWQGQKARLEYMQSVDHLWRTERVQKVVASIFKIIRQQMTLLVDNVEQQTSLSNRQREIIIALADGTLGDCRDTVLDDAKTWPTDFDKEDADPAKG